MAESVLLFFPPGKPTRAIDALNTEAAPKYLTEPCNVPVPKHYPACTLRMEWGVFFYQANASVLCPQSINLKISLKEEEYGAVSSASVASGVKLTL